MALDSYFLDKTIDNNEIVFTLRYYWKGYWLSLGYHQKEIPPHWEKLSKEGLIKIVRRPSGGGAVLHSGGITYAITSKKPFYKNLSYEIVNTWLIKSFSKLGLELRRGETKSSIINDNCFGSAYLSDLIDQNGNKRIGSAQYWKKGSFLQHGEIQLNPPQDLWLKLFNKDAPPKLKLKISNNEIIKFLKKSFIEKNSNIFMEKVNLNNEYLKKFIKID